MILKRNCCCLSKNEVYLWTVDKTRFYSASRYSNRALEKVHEIRISVEVDYFSNSIQMGEKTRLRFVEKKIVSFLSNIS